MDQQDAEHGLSALMMASHRGLAECVAILLKAGGDAHPHASRRHHADDLGEARR